MSRNNSNSMLNKRKQARYYIVYEGKTQAETAKLVGVTEKTVGSWVKQYGWLRAAENLLSLSKPVNSLSDFIVFVNTKHPGKYEQIRAMFFEFLTTI